MIRAAIMFFVLAIVAYLFGAYSVAGLSMEIGRILLYVFLILAFFTFIFSISFGKNVK
jgi:uncharacterized membrane protein YtjA (UPF0391 family)